MTLPVNSPIVINIAVIAIIVISLISGYIKGFLWQVVKIIGIIAIILISWILAPGMSELIQVFPKDFAPFSYSVLADLFYNKINTICWFIILLLIGILLILILKPIFKAITLIPIVKNINGILGAITALIPSTVFIIIVTYMLNTVLFTNGKDIINNSLLKYTNVVVENVGNILNKAFAQNVAIQKMVSDPLSLTNEDLENIINWMKDNSISSEDIYNFLKQYGIDTVELNNLLNNNTNEE